MTKRSQVEIERKYDVDEGTIPPRLVGAGPVALESAPETVESDRLRTAYTSCTARSSVG